MPGIDTNFTTPVLSTGDANNGPSLPLTGVETIPMQTNLTAGKNPQSVAATSAQLLGVGAFQTLTGTTAGSTGFTPNPTTGRNFAMTWASTVPTCDFKTPTNMTPGVPYMFKITQSNPATTGVMGLSTDLTILWARGAKTLSTAAGAIDVITMVYDGTKVLANLSSGYTT